MEIDGKNQVEKTSIIGYTIEKSNKIRDGYAREDFHQLSSRRFRSGAGRIYDRLNTYFSGHEIFMDVDDIEPGEDFVKASQNTVCVGDILIALIGEKWLTIQ